MIAASHVRIATVKLPPMAASRVAGAAGFALEDQLAGAPAEHHLGVSAQAPDGRVRVVVVARALVAAIVAGEPRISRIIAEPELAAPIAGWRWCADEGGTAFVRCSDGSAFPVDAPPADGALPSELALALARAERDGAAPAQLRVDATIADAALARLQREAGVAVMRGNPWRWHAAPAASFASALDLRPSAPATAAAAPQRRLGRAFAPALILGGAALAIHVVASVGEWAALRVDAWRSAREWTDLAVAAGVPSDAATTPQAARAALARRYALLRHAQGLAAPDDALPLLARAASALAALPPGSVKSARLRRRPLDARARARRSGDHRRPRRAHACSARAHAGRNIGERSAPARRRSVMALTFTTPRAPAPFARWLAGKTRTERRVVVAIVVAVAIAVLWLALWEPLRRDADAMRAAHAVSAAELATARKMTEEAAGLARTPAAPAPVDPRAALDRILSQQNLRGAVTQLDWQEGRAHVVFAAVPYDALIALLEALQREGGLRAVDATLTARVEPGTVRAELTLAR